MLSPGPSDGASGYDVSRSLDVRLLLVEDELRAAQMLSKGLREHSYAVDVASTGEQALYQPAIAEIVVSLLFGAAATLTAVLLSDLATRRGR
jgi:CheY-like chemotaxis protein